MSELRDNYELALRDFMSKHVDLVMDRDGVIVSFHEMEPYLQDYCSDTGISFVGLVNWLIDEGWLEEFDVPNRGED